MIKLSFILPCYNVGRYIAACLDSLFSLQEIEFEVICINDCSTDNTRNVILDYAKRYSNLVFIDHLYNKTAGGARNAGIEIARGEYIWFVDPDDMIKPTSAPVLLRKMEEGALDLLMFNFEDVDENLVFIGQDRTLVDSGIMSGQEYVSSYFGGKMNLLGIVWRCMFRTSFIKENRLYYPSIRKSQDVVFIWKALLKAKKVQSDADVHYRFRVNPYSVTHNVHHANVLFSERILFGKEVVLILNDPDYRLSDDIRHALLQTVSWCANSNLEALKMLSSEEVDKYYDLAVIHRVSIDTLKPYMNWKNRLLLDVRFSRRQWKTREQLILNLFS